MQKILENIGMSEKGLGFLALFGVRETLPSTLARRANNKTSYGVCGFGATFAKKAWWAPVKGANMYFQGR